MKPKYLVKSKRFGYVLVDEDGNEMRNLNENELVAVGYLIGIGKMAFRVDDIEV